MTSSRKRTSLANTRKGVAVVEFAVCLPVVLLVVFGSIQAASMLFLRQAAVQAAYEGVKVAIRADASNGLVDEAANSVIAGRKLSGVSIQTEPENVVDSSPGETVQVLVTIPSDENTLFPFGLFRNKEISALAVMVKE